MPPKKSKLEKQRAPKDPTLGAPTEEPGSSGRPKRKTATSARPGSAVPTSTAPSREMRKFPREGRIGEYTGVHKGERATSKVIQKTGRGGGLQIGKWTDELSVDDFNMEVIQEDPVNAALATEKNLTDANKEKYKADMLRMLFPGKSKECYEIKGKIHGLVISNTFDDENTKIELERTEPGLGDTYEALQRHGGEKDRKTVTNLFQFLNVEVEPHENVKSHELLDILKKFQSKLTEKDAAVIIVMSHGGLPGKNTPDSITMDDMKEVTAWKDVIYAFINHNIVRKIPKVFLMNMCRDSYDEDGVKADSGKYAYLFKNSLTDALVLFSTLPHEPAVRLPAEGTLYITTINKVFRNSAKKLTLKEMVEKVHSKMVDEYGQTPQLTSFTFKDIQFQPRH